ncbi:MAG TPA: helix-turn-helix domain-containing protein [Anaerolineae bacterium]
MADLLTTNQVQQLLQVNRTTIYRMVESGQLPAIRVGKQWRFSRTDIDHWLQTKSVLAAAPNRLTAGANGASPTPAYQQPALYTPGQLPLKELLAFSCVQLIQDAFADILGVMLVITDMQGHPVTQISNPCGFYTALTQDPEAIAHCVRLWQEMAANPAISPRFMPNEMGLLCARGLVRVQSEIKGMVVIGGIAPDVWPPSDEQLSCLAETFGLDTATVEGNVEAVYRLDKLAQDKALRSVQRIADIFSHIAEDRSALCGRLQTIASLTTL